MRLALATLVLVGMARMAFADGIFPDCPELDEQPCNSGCASRYCTNTDGSSCSAGHADLVSVGTSLGLVSLVAYRLTRKRIRRPR